MLNMIPTNTSVQNQEEKRKIKRTELEFYNFT